MVRILGYWGPNFSEILHFPRPSKATLVFKKKKKKRRRKNPKERHPPQRGQRLGDRFFAFESYST
jgi:hypothetical protein